MENLLKLNSAQKYEVEYIINKSLLEYNQKIGKRLEYTADMGNLQYMDHKIDKLEHDLKIAKETIELLIGLLTSKQVLIDNEIEDYNQSLKLMKKLKEAQFESI